MQAHPQSSPAARISLLSPPTMPSPYPLPPEALAHDARNLLNALGLYCELLKLPGVLRPEHFHYATELNLIAARSSAMMLRLLEGGDAPPTMALDLSPAEVMRNYVPVLQQLAGNSVKITVTAAAFLPPVELPTEALERITLNLVSNAVQALQHTSNAEVRVDLSMRSSKLQLTVEDNGPGIPPGLAAAFLQPTPLPPGATRGVGHRIIHELAAATGGHLSIRVRPGNGTVFCLKWPVSDTPVALTDLDASTTTTGETAA